MPDQCSDRIFISYSRKDGADFAAELRERLLRENLSIWQDLVALEGGRDWWSQIEDVLRSKALEHFVIVVTSKALASDVVRREIRLARQEGKTVCPIKGPGLTDLAELPRWLGQIYDLNLPEHVTKLIHVLKGPSTQKRVAMMAPEMPKDFVPRPAEFGALKKMLLDAKGDAVAITAALRGAGGYGKTTLATALAHDPEVQDAYFDGILWVTLGEKPENLLLIISDLVETLTGTRPGLATPIAAAAKLSESLGDRRILLIVDDTWREQDLNPFLQGGPRTTRLITTRLSRVVPPGAYRQVVDAMKDREARELLSRGLPTDQVLTQSKELNDLAGRLGEWAQLLKLVNGFLRERVIEVDQGRTERIRCRRRRRPHQGRCQHDQSGPRPAG
jgi:NB-ARC domain/TIR domain